MRIRSCYQAMSRSGITEDMIKRFRFDTFSVIQDYQAKIKQTALRYVQSDLTGWLLISGQSGTGKTHICTACARYLLGKGYTVKYVLWHDVARRLAALRYKIDEYEAYMKEISDAEVLYIDDLFKSNKETGAAFEVINQRYMSRKPTIISSELFIGDIMAMDEATGSRLNEMSKDHCCQIRNEPNRNYRNKE